ncbi:MAG: carbon-nitrogen hydrolase family protein [Candidatus Bathyarchaeota archaeon]|nr:carbon-nitrogen hydrolase family protein [Candidatus Bathyarchaeota archaeon]MDH5746535.1 carbon-nitrogen hydrolase family protein [Candidatus Bathyarchaeota archaeon]
MREKFKVALAQISCKRGDKTENIRKIEDNVVRAKKQGAELVIFPELSVTGYVLRDQIYELAETIPGQATNILEKLAVKTGTYIVFGLPELSDKTQATIYNAAVLVGPDGLIGKYRKMYLPTHSVFEEKRYFRPGYQTAVFETELGKIGLIICYDVFFPEVSRLTRLKGAQLIVCISASPATRRAFFETLTVARAIENTAFLAYVNLVGIEDGLQFWGGSRLIGPNGRVLVKTKYDKEDLVIGEVNYADIRPIETFVPMLKDLRPELFDKLKENAEKL